jgi:hypothetical protein
MRENQMNWPIQSDWTCETCGAGPRMLSWGLAHGDCYCYQCGHPYTMKQDGRAITRPISELRDELVEAAKNAWNDKKWRMDRLTEKEWLKYGAPKEFF